MLLPGSVKLFKLNNICSRFASQSSITLRFNNIQHQERGLRSKFDGQETRSSAISSDDNDDFFGIKHFSADDVKGVDSFDSEKKQKLEEKIKQISNLERLKVSDEGFLRSTTYGQVRYDQENKVDYMGQFENSSNNVLLEKKRLYMFEIGLANSEKGGNSNSNQPQEKNTAPLNYIDQQYFDSSDKNQAESATNLESNFIDYQYFKENYSPELTPEGLPTGPIRFRYTSKWNEYKEYLDSRDNSSVRDNRKSPQQMIEDLEGLTFAGDTPLRSVEEVTHELMLIKKNSENDEEIEESTESTEIKMDYLADAVEESIDQEDFPKTALDYINKIRGGELRPEDESYLKHLEEKFKKFGSEFKLRPTTKNKITYDSTGKRNFLEQSPKLNLLRRNDLVQLLAQRVIFNERDLIAIDKPNGLVVEGGESNSKYPTLESLLPDLSRALFNEEGQLFTVHRLDRDATGVLLLARSLSMVKTLRDMFSERKINKYYWAIIRGIPDPLSAIINIPIEAATMNGIERMILRPECDVDFNREIGATRGASPAVTHYRTLRKFGNACLVELKPEQGIKHQIRVHLGFGLRTPILGDHKYSHLDRLAPQKLPDDMLHKLNIRQSKVRNIPLHLHSKLYIVPEIGINGGSISIPAHLPQFFSQNMKSLGLFRRDSVLKTPIAF